MTRPVEIHIEELVITGVALVHEERLPAAIEAALRAHLSADPLPAGGAAGQPALAALTVSCALRAPGVDALAAAVAAAVVDGVRTGLEGGPA